MRIIDQEKFDKIVRHARQTNPFYARWIPPGGPVPILTRQVLQEHNDEILNGQPVCGKTSGSTAVPVRVSADDARLRMGFADDRRLIELLGGPMPWLDIVVPMPWKDPAHLVPVYAPLEEQAAGIASHAAQHAAIAIRTYPSNAVLLAQYLLDRQITFPTVRRLVLFSEAIDGWQRALIQRAFPDAYLWSTYSAIEVGTISFQCPHEAGFHHLMSHKLGIEILDDHLDPAPFGEIGQVIVTDYFNFRMPIIRYSIGDLAAFGHCPCGKIDLPAFSQVLGKVRGALLHANGRRIPFIQFGIVLRDLPGIRQYQVIQEELRRFTFKVVGPASLDELIHAAFLKEFGYSPEIDIQHMEEIPRDPSGKFHFSICKV